MVVPVAIYLAINAGHSSAHGWGVAMSTDTAFALGMLALVGPRFSGRLRAFMLTVVVVDDVVALIVIATAYAELPCTRSRSRSRRAFLVARARACAMRASRRGLVYAPLAVAMWVARASSRASIR